MWSNFMCTQDPLSHAGSKILHNYFKNLCRWAIASYTVGVLSIAVYLRTYIYSLVFLCMKTA